MSYLDKLPRYVYTLPCGTEDAPHEFRTLTASLPDGEDGCHWFYCRPCEAYRSVAPEALREEPPRFASGRLCADSQLAIRIDAAIVKDRIKRLYLSVWDSMSVREVAAALDVDRRHVEAVSLDMGIYERSAGYADSRSDF